MRKTISLLLVVTTIVFNLFPPDLAAQTAGGIRPGSSAVPAASAPRQAMPQTANIPYYSLRDGMTSTLTLNNSMPAPMQVSMTVYSLNGKAFRLPDVSVAAASYSDFNLGDLLAPAGDEFREGNIEVRYTGVPDGVTAKVSVFSATKRVSYESHIHSSMDFGSTDLDGIFSLPESHAEGYLAVTNVASTPVSAQVAIRSKATNFAVSPRETHVVKVTEVLGQAPPLDALVHLQHNGKPGDLVAIGFVLDLNNRYAATVGVIDPAIMRSNNLSEAHFRFGQPDASEGFPQGTSFSAPLLLANVSSQPLNAHVTADYTINGKANQVNVKEIALAPGALGTVDLATEMVRLGLVRVDDAGIDITYDGPAGSLMAQMSSVDQSGDYSFDEPFKDPASMNEGSGGSYPFTLEGGSNTIVHIKNTTGEKVFALVQLRFPDGSIYNPDRLWLEPHQTVSVDIQKLKSDNKKDVRGSDFPQNATRGQFIWLMTRNHALIGRAEQVNISMGTANSFTCYYPCPCDPSPADWWMSPDSGEYLADYSGSPFDAEETYMDCNHQYFGPYNQNSYASWSTSNSSALSVSGAGNITANDYGQSWLFADWDDYYWFSDSEGCWSDVEPLEAAALIQVRKPMWMVRLSNDINTRICGLTTTNELDRDFGVYDSLGRIYDVYSNPLYVGLSESFTSQEHCDVGIENYSHEGDLIEDAVATCQSDCTATVRQTFQAGTTSSPAAIQVRDCPSCSLHTGYNLTITKQSPTASPF